MRSIGEAIKFNRKLRAQEQLNDPDLRKAIEESLKPPPPPREERELAEAMAASMKQPPSSRNYMMLRSDWMCPNCGFINLGSDSKCTNCGFRRRTPVLGPPGSYEALLRNIVLAYRRDHGVPRRAPDLTLESISHRPADDPLWGLFTPEEKEAQRRPGQYRRYPKPAPKVPDPAIPYNEYPIGEQEHAAVFGRRHAPNPRAELLAAGISPEELNAQGRLANEAYARSLSGGGTRKRRRTRRRKTRGRRIRQ